MQLLLTLEVGLDASVARADLLVGVHMRHLVHVVLLNRLEQVRADEGRVHALDRDVLVEQVTVIPVAVGGVERVARHAVLGRTMVFAVVDVGVHILGAEHAHAHHAVVGVVLGEVAHGLGDADGGMLARQVRRVVAQAGDQAGDGCGEQEVAGRALFLEDGQHLVHVIGQAEHVCVHGPGPVLRRMVVDPASGGDAGVGEHQVELAVLLHDAHDAEADLFILRDVGLDGDDLRCAGLLADGLGLFQTFGVDVDEGEAHAALGSLFGEGTADASGGTGDGGNFVLEFFHVLTSFL